MNSITPLGAQPIALATAHEVAEFLGTTPNQLARLRYEGYGPDYVKLGRSCSAIDGSTSIGGSKRMCSPPACAGVRSDLWGSSPHPYRESGSNF
jgi:hypothetical protein